MGKLKKGILATVAVVVGIITLKKFRGRGNETDEETI